MRSPCEPSRLRATPRSEKPFCASKSLWHNLRMWPDRRIQDLLGIEAPIIQAPMAGFVTAEMVIAVSDAGGLGSLPCALLNADQIRAELGIIRERTSRPVNVNFFCHHPPEVDPERELAWRNRLASYYV